ncbi:response regulator [Teredinibacter turnerae]|uniref:response regulator n=1 Tax=Teredinibacter turnerae TaxID=2426 RepID=UPI00037F241F|nr:response regulator [Teredinibacter turnerae]
MSATVLIVEDEAELALLMRDYLLAAGFHCEIIGNGLEVEPWLSTNTADIILLDLMLPGKNGLDICRELRSQAQFKTLPIIMVTAKVEEIDRLLGLELGADDYVCKPFSPREIVARVKAVLRRVQLPQEQPQDSASQAVQLHENSQQVSISGSMIELTTIEFCLFKLLYTEQGRIFSRQYIMDNIYSDYRVVSDRTVDSHIKKLRKKMQEADPELELIHSVYGAGYKYELQHK